jgi:VanZ family protein
LSDEIPVINLKSSATTSLATALLAVLVIILLAGLWPLNPFPANNVTWLKSGNGLSLGRNPLVLSRLPLHFADPCWSSISLEIWLHPTGNWRALTFFSIYTPENPKQFRMMYYHNSLFIKRNRRNTKGKWEDTGIEVDKVVYRNTSLFITITAGPNGSSIYFNGRPAQVFPGYALSGCDLSGQLIFGTSPFEKQTWQGEWRGLAIYGAELSPADVLDHYQKWTNGRQAELAKELAPAVLYDFHEGTGDTIHDLAGTSSDLFIPEHYSVPHKPILHWPWEEYHPDRSYAVDIAVNIAAFMPLGFLLSAFLWSSTSCQRPMLTTILLGALLSLTIEVLQAYIPQRFSGMTDIITNTMGTSMGAILCGQKKVKALWTRLGLSRQE